MENTAPEKPKLTVISKDGIAAQAAQPATDTSLTEVTSPAIIHRQIAQKIDVSLNDLGIPAPEGGVVTHPAEEKPMEETDDIKAVAGRVMGENLEIAKNAINDKVVYPIFGSSPDISKFSYGESEEAEDILEDRKKKEQAAEAEDSEDLAA